jgi:V8-like Glu-specific endopeptidase
MLGYTEPDPEVSGTSDPVEKVGQEIEFTPHGWGWQDCDDTYESWSPQPACVTQIWSSSSCAPYSTPGWPWNQPSCAASPEDNRYYDEDDDRWEVDPSLNARTKAIVQVERRSGNDWKLQCTGTILRDRYVLTAAHCVYDSQNNRIPNPDLRVVRADLQFNPGKTIGVSQKHIPSGYSSPGADPKDDYTLLRLDAPFVQPFSDMDVSSASDSTMSNLGGVFNLAYPAYERNCGLNGWRHLLRNDDETLGSIYSKKVNLKMDSGPGHSGSPVYYCPDGDSYGCVGTEEGFILAIISGWNGFETTVVGPKGASFRDWATGIMDNNP